MLSLGDWRRSRVNDLIRAVYKAVKEENQSCTFGISPAAGIANDRDSLYADVKTWATQKGYCDYLCPQVYFGFLNDTLPFMKTVKDWRVIFISACRCINAARQTPTPGGARPNSRKIRI